MKIGSKGPEVKELQHLLNQNGFHLSEDGDFGQATDKAVRQFQSDTGLKVDGIVGSLTLGKLKALAGLGTDENEVHNVKASSFADPADIKAFKKCKAQGKSDQECFKVGDNGVGKWGDDTTTSVPMCALPPDDWELVSNPRGKKVLVKFNGKSVVCELRDTMPRKKNIKNGAGIDLNFAAWKALGKTPPVMEKATWQWV